MLEGPPWNQEVYWVSSEERGSSDYDSDDLSQYSWPTNSDDDSPSRGLIWQMTYSPIHVTFHVNNLKKSETYARTSRFH